MSKKGYSISLNERSLGGSVFEDSIEALLLGGTEVVVLVRNVCVHVFMLTSRSYQLYCVPGSYRG